MLLPNSRLDKRLLTSHVGVSFEGVGGVGLTCPPKISRYVNSINLKSLPEVYSWIVANSDAQDLKSCLKAIWLICLTIC